jgi:integrase
MPRPNRPELALLRGKSTAEALARWTESFAGGDRETAEKYAAILSRFTGKQASGAEYEAYMGAYSPATRRAYSFALTEFFEWLATKHKRVVPPPQVTRKDAEDYVEWLITRPYSLEGEKLRDGDQRERLTLYEIVGELGSADILSIAAKTPGWLRTAHPAPGVEIDRGWLNRELGRMVLHDLLVRSPTMEDLRREDARIGIGVFTLLVPDGDTMREMPLEEIFSYTLPRARAVSRTTVVVRVAALTSFWQALMEADNSSGAGALVRHNVFSDVGNRVRVGLAADRRASRARKGRLTPELVERLLRVADGPSLAEKRDAALLWFLVLTGARVTEITRIRRGRPPAAEAARWPGWYDERAVPPAVELVRKRGFRQRLPFPPYALKALAAFQAELARHAPLTGTQSDNQNEPHYLAPTAPGWRYKALAEEPDAPLFPPVKFWGANSSRNYQEFKPNANVRPDYRRSMTRNGIDAILKKIAKKAGFTEEEQALAHTHAFRHFAATAMARRGKPIREIQYMLGHESLVTTERYVEPETSTEALSGQNEILDFIAGAAHEPPAPAEPEAPRQPPTRPARVVETYAVPPGRPGRPQAGPRPEKKRRPPPEVQAPEAGGMPAQSPRVVPEAQVEPGQGLVAIAPKGGVEPPHVSQVRGNISPPPTPLEAYGALAPHPPGVPPTHPSQIAFTRVNLRTAKPKERALVNLAPPGDKRDLVQQVTWLRANYDPWPMNYGIDEQWLLPWFARGSASSGGEVTVDIISRTGERKIVVVPPIPVLSHYQMDPGLAPKHAPKLWQSIDQMRTRWLRTVPTKAFGLDRWWGMFLQARLTLGQVTKGKFTWVPFNTPAEVGTQIRSHDDEYLSKWLEINAERYGTTINAFEDIRRIERASEDDSDEAQKEWEEFQSTWRDASLMGVSPAAELPDWFIADDPVRDIYDRDPEEWRWFSTWFGAITGQNLTPVRDETLKAEEAFALEERSNRILQARKLLEGYYEAVTDLRTSKGDEREGGHASLKAYVAQLAEYGIPDPAQMLKEGKLRKKQRREASIEQLLNMAFPDVGVEVVDPNVLRSQLFDADTLRLDMSRKTISHTDEFRKRFAARYDGRDSECVVRRAARGMWEHVKRNGIPVARGEQRASQYSLLYSVMLSYMAWIFPCPAEIEERMAKEGRLGAEARLVWLNGVRSATQHMARIERDADEPALLAVAAEDGLDSKSAEEVLEAGLVVDSVRAQVAVPPPEVAEAVAKSAVESGQVAVESGGVVVVRPTVLRRRKSPSALREEAREERSPVPAPPAPRAPEPTARERIAEMRGRRGAVVELVQERAQTTGTYLSGVEEPEVEEQETPLEREAEYMEPEVEQYEGPQLPSMFSVGGEQHESAETTTHGLAYEELERNAAPPRYMTLGAYAAGADYVANAEEVLPSAIRMMAAMTLPF